MAAKAVIVDGYLDEPSCLGVPPYISPHVRYTFGAMVEAGLAPDEICYWTIDQLRQQPRQVEELAGAELVTIIAGTTVPGRYLGGKPVSLQEINNITGKIRGKTVLSGPIAQCGLDTPHVDVVAGEVPGRDEFVLLTGSQPEGKAPQLVDRWAVAGAQVTARHPRFPRLVCEIETFRGCPRSSHCLFCSEQLKKVTYQRRVEGVVAEVAALAAAGNCYFRLGAQTDLLLYQGEGAAGNLRPNPRALEQLFRGIRRAAPGLKVLHIDNINPATIAENRELAAEALTIIANNNTPGDTAAFGLESADPVVLAANNISTDGEKTMAAIEIMNEVGGWREQGMPKLLPGINFLHGLQGESRKTMELNLAFLHRVLERNLLLRRINVRQVNPLGRYARTAAYSPFRFNAYKERINHEINRPMLRRLFPRGTLLADLEVEQVRGELAFCRQLGSYPILVGVPGRYREGSVLSAKVVDHGYRSITGLPWPLDINRATMAQLETLPGIGKNRARKIFLAGGLENMEQLQRLLPDCDLEPLQKLICFGSK